MHIAEGALPLSECIVGYLITAIIIGLTLKYRKITLEDVPRLALFTAIFFVASLIHMNVGPSSVHLLLSGLIGMILGPHAFIAAFIALFLQAVLVGFGGISTLGVNTIDMGLPALIAWIIASRVLPKLRDAKQVAVLGAAIGAVSVLLVVALTVSWLYVAAMILHRPSYIAACVSLALFHLPVVAAEAVITGTVMYALTIAKPDVLTPVYGSHILRIARVR